MEDEVIWYDYYNFRYKNKSGLPGVIYARTPEKADEIISWWNKDVEPKWQWKRKRIGFAHKVKLDKDPDVFESQQLKFAKEKYEERKNKK